MVRCGGVDTHTGNAFFCLGKHMHSAIFRPIRERARTRAHARARSRKRHDCANYLSKGKDLKSSAMKVFGKTALASISMSRKFK